MPFNTADAVPRADISTLLMEAVDQEKHFVGQAILPIYTSERETGRYPKFTKGPGALLNKESTKRGPTGTYNEIDRRFEWDSFTTEEFGLEERVDDKVVAQMQDFFDAEMITGKLLMRALMLDYEVEVASAIMNASNFTATNSGTAYTEANVEGNTPFDFPADMNALIERLTLKGETPNTAIMSLSVFNRIKRSKKLQTYVYGHLNTAQGGTNITEQVIAAAFGLQQVIVTKQSYNMAAKGRTPNLGPIWGNSYVFVGNIQGGDFMNGGIGRTIVWGADSPGGLFTSESYRHEPRRGTMLRVRSNRVLKIVNSEAGELLGTQWS